MPDTAFREAGQAPRVRTTDGGVERIRGVGSIARPSRGKFDLRSGFQHRRLRATSPPTRPAALARAAGSVCVLGWLGSSSTHRRTGQTLKSISFRSLESSDYI